MANQMDEKMKASNFTKKRCEEILACRKACAQKGIECKRSSVEAIGAVMFLDGLEAGREGMRGEIEAQRKGHEFTASKLSEAERQRDLLMETLDIFIEVGYDRSRAVKVFDSINRGKAS